MSITADMDERQYHAHEALSSTQARLLLRSPAKYRWSLTHPQAPREVFDVGTAVHSKVLGIGAEVVALDFDSFRSRAAQEARDTVRSAGQVPVLATTYAEVEAMAEAVLAHPLAKSFLEVPGRAEASVFSTDPVSGVDVRARFDFLPDPGKRRRVAVDLKTTLDASPDGFARSAASYGYHVQLGHYLHALEFETGESAAMVFVTVEKEPPYLVAVHQLDSEFTDMGFREATEARHILAECRRRDEWPGYPESLGLLKPPVWAIYNFQDRFDTGDEIRM